MRSQESGVRMSVVKCEEGVSLVFSAKLSGIICVPEVSGLRERFLCFRVSEFQGFRVPGFQCVAVF